MNATSQKEKPTVDEMDSIATMDALRIFGFVPDSDVMSDGCPGMSYDFGGFKLTAGQFLTLEMREVVSFSGMYRTANALGMIEFDIPRRVESNEQCAAWIAWQLNHQLPRRAKLISRGKSDWLTYGLQHQDTLPWVRQQAAYAARPHCSVSREWVRLALTTLVKHLAAVSGDAQVEFSFDGAVLSIRCAEKNLISLAAEGLPWPDRYIAFAERFREPPGRFMRETVELSIWEDRLTIGGRRYGPVTKAGESVYA
jgi:hypothetical protein